jgi:hypothetical protein
MGSLISDSDKTNIGNVFNDMHDTFARDVIVFQRENEIFVATNGTYNALYSRLKDQTTKRTKVTKTTVQARIRYQQDQREMDLPGTQAQVNVPMGEGQVRVKIDKAGYDMFKKATNIEIDGDAFRIVSDASKVGPFVVHFYTIYLRRAD